LAFKTFVTDSERSQMQEVDIVATIFWFAGYLSGIYIVERLLKW
jgi:hypothetical protein